MRRSLYFFFIGLLLMAFASCQKDDSVKEASQSLKVDSARLLATASTTGNVLAVTGTLKIVIQDSTYTFDAAKDSIAFVNVYMDNKKYFGITAINKAHTMSFGISSQGAATANLASPVAGSQFLFNGTAKNSFQYTLSQNIGMQEPGKINIAQFSRDSILAKGTFTTYLAKDGQSNPPFYKAEGSFELKKK